MKARRERYLLTSLQCKGQMYRVGEIQIKMKSLKPRKLPQKIGERNGFITIMFILEYDVYQRQFTKRLQRSNKIVPIIYASRHNTLHTCYKDLMHVNR